jgi:hypothetical protein
MGEAYKKAYRFGDAARMYRRVVDLEGDYRTQADRSWELMERIQRAAPGTTLGKRVALVEGLTRGETAALFVQELRLDEVYARASTRNSGPSQPSAASGHQPEPMARPPAAVDMGNHPLRQDVDALLRLGVRGLELYPDQTFRPGETVTRAAFAVMMEDILTKVKGEAPPVFRSTAISSPFVDVDNNLPYFHAVMVCTSLGIMSPVDSRGREFRPLDTISGVEALLAVQSLKEHLTRIMHETPAATADLAILPGVLGSRTLRRTVKVRLRSESRGAAGWSPGGTTISMVSRRHLVHNAG